MTSAGTPLPGVILPGVELFGLFEPDAVVPLGVPRGDCFAPRGDAGLLPGERALGSPPAAPLYPGYADGPERRR